jgi:hypothetical protein
VPNETDSEIAPLGHSEQHWACAQANRLLLNVPLISNMFEPFDIMEDYNIHRAHRYIATLFLAAGLTVPVSVMAGPVPQEKQETKDQHRVYDKDHKDYHNWDDNENRNWERFLAENHRNSHEFSKAHKTEQSEYWNWRHTQPDKN